MVVVDMHLKISDWLADQLENAARERGVKPADLMADVIETVIKDRLYDAVLDDKA